MRTFVLVVLVLFSSAIFADNVPSYLVGTKVAPPFSYMEDGVWKGYSIDLLDALSEEMGFKYQLARYDNVTGLLKGAASEEVDFSIAAISTTNEREHWLDFSHPYFITTQGILTKNNGSIVWWVLQRVGAALGILVTMMYVVGFIVAHLDPHDEINNAHKGAWFALVTFTTTGYGDYVPANARAKFVAAMWMVASLFLLSLFTGYIASSLTVKELTSTPTTIQDLHRSKVVTLGGTTSQALLSALGIKHIVTNDLEVAKELVLYGKADALVYDKAMLDYMAMQTEEDIEVWPINRGQERYAIAFPQGSNLREPFNVSILKLINTPEWDTVTLRYFGDQN